MACLWAIVGLLPWGKFLSVSAKLIKIGLRIPGFLADAAKAQRRVDELAALGGKAREACERLPDLRGRAARAAARSSGPPCEIGPQGWPVPTMSNCLACAHEIQKIIGGDIIHIKGANSLGPSAHDPHGSWTHHYAVVKDDVFYDGFTGPNGIPFEQYKAQWEYGDYLNFVFVE